MILLKLPFKLNVGVRKNNWLQLAPSMNVQIREHFHAKKKRKSIISDLIRKQMGEDNFNYEIITKINKKTKQPYEAEVYTWKDGAIYSVSIVYRRGSVSLLDPIDNFGASFKAIGDVLVELGILVDDASSCIASFKPVAHKVAKQKEAYIEVEIHAST